MTAADDPRSTPARETSSASGAADKASIEIAALGAAPTNGPAKTRVTAPATPALAGATLAPQLLAADLWRAISYMLAASVAFAGMAVVIRLASSTLHAFEIAFFRNFFGFVFALPLLARHGMGLLRTDKWGLYATRCVIGVVSMFCSFWAIAHMPLAQAVTISFSTPIFVTIGAVFMLGEVVRARRWSAVIIGFIGVLMIVQPGSTAFEPAALIALTAALLSGLVTVSIKVLARTEKPDAIVLITTLLWVPMSLGPALAVWEWPQGLTWVYVVAAGLLGTVGHMCWTRALQRADASLLTPISFAQVPLVAVAGWLFFGEALTAWVIAGAAVIFIANAYIAHREAALARRPQ